MGYRTKEYKPIPEKGERLFKVNTYIDGTSNYHYVQVDKKEANNLSEEQLMNCIVRRLGMDINIYEIDSKGDPEYIGSF